MVTSVQHEVLRHDRTYPLKLIQSHQMKKFLTQRLHDLVLLYPRLLNDDLLETNVHH